MKITLAVTLRDESTTLNTLRANGNVPAVVYGPKQEAIHVSISGKDFDKVRKKAGESTIIELTGLKNSVDVLLKDVEFSPVKQQVLHADFYAIEKGKEITAHVQINFIGESPAENSKAGVITKVLHEVEVTCKPDVLPAHIDVDISSLVAVGDKILVKDLPVDKTVKISAEAESPVVLVAEKKEEVEEESVAVDMDAIEVEQKGKGETEDETEG